MGLWAKFSKSSVHRHLQAMDRRDRYPESSLWETEAGRNWLIRLVVATLFVFGLKRGVGAETLSEFFSRLRLEGHMGCSPSALRSVIHTLERLLLDTAAVWEKEGIAHGEIRPVIGAVDETFLQGSVANIAQGAMKGQLPLSGWGLGGQRVEQCGHSEALFPGLHDHLSFLDHVHEFDPDQGILGGVKRFKPQHRPCHALYCPMVLFHDIV